MESKIFNLCFLHRVSERPPKIGVRNPGSLLRGENQTGAQVPNLQLGLENVKNPARKGDRLVPACLTLKDNNHPAKEVNTPGG